MADILSPRERGGYMGLFAGVMSIGLVGGPLLGGVLTDSVGWHWNFYVGIPLGVAAFIVLTKTLKIRQARPAKIRIDYIGIVLLSVAAGFLLVWISNVQSYGWISWETLYMVGISVVATTVFIIVEMRVAEPLIPMNLFRNRTFTLAVLASISIGVSMFGTSVYLAQYMQVSRGFGPTEAGLMTIPMAVGMMGSSRGHRPARLAHGQVEALRRARRCADDRRHVTAFNTAVRHSAVVGGRVHVPARRRHGNDDAEPRAGRAERLRPA